MVKKKIKRLMAYSGIVNVGYMLIGIASGTIAGIVGLFIYLVVYVIMTIGFFSFILGMQKINPNSLNVYLIDLINIGKTNTKIALTISLILFSIIGLPPLGGFFGKMYLFLAAMSSELYAAAILGVLSSVIAAFYYLRIIKLMFFESSKLFSLYKELDQSNSYVLTSSIFLLMLFSILFQALLSSCHGGALNILM
jgi:NADH-quinone oxidoreductase subunit N